MSESLESEELILPTWDVRFDKELAPLYRVTRKTISTYSRRGAPLRNPELMPGWWSENMKHTAPAWVLDAAARVKRETAEVGPAEAGEGYRFSVMSEDETSWDELVRMQRRIVGAYAKELDEATSNDRPFESINRRYQQAVTTLRHLEKDSAKIEIESGRAWSKDGVAEVLVEVGTAINTAMDNLPHLLKAKLGLDVPAMRKVEEEVNRMRQPLAQLREYMDGAA